MKLIEMRCPNCDAPLSVNADRDEASCRHCNTTFLIEDAPSTKVGNRPETAAESAAKPSGPEEEPTETAVEFEKAKSEPPDARRFSGKVSAIPRPKAKACSAKREAKTEAPKKATATEITAVRKSLEDKAVKRLIAIAAAVAVALLVAIMAFAGTCSTNGSHDSASRPGVSSSSAASTTSRSSETAETSAAATQSSSASASPTQDSSATAKDGFPCNLDSTATFSGVTIPIDSTWKDNSTDWDWRHRAYSYTAGTSTLGDVQISISAFTGGDTKDAVAFMEDYADFGPIFLDAGNFTVKSRETRDGVTCTRVEGVSSYYESAFSYNPVYKHGTIREMYSDKVVRCICLVGYAEDGKGFAVAVALRGSADNDECLHSANKILDGVTFAPAECDIDSDDLWLYEVQH